MLLKNLMEEKHELNFDQPLLSVRRHSPTVTSQKRDSRKINSYSHQLRPHLPTYKSELKSGPIRNPGAVPFLWEQSPGLPKEEMKPQARNSHKPPVAPRLPPGWAKHQDDHNVSRNSAGCKSQAVDVSYTSESMKHDLEILSYSRVGPSNDENVRNFESENERDCSDSGDTDDAYVDALDSLSRTESYFLNCSMSGVSGLEDLDVKPLGSFLRDPQACEFMMDRFLPAAKAMVSDTPHPPKKQPVQMQIQQPNRTAGQYKPSLRYGPSFAQRYAYYQDNEEEDESDDECDQQANLPSVCGLLPRFCLKSSLCLLSPFPAASVRTRAPSFSANKVRPGSSSSGSYCELENEEQFRSDRSETKSTEKIQTAELDEHKAGLRSESGQLESQTLPFLEQREALPVPNENRHVGVAGFGLHSKGLKTFQELLDDHGSLEESDSGDQVIEKTVYVDMVQKAESPNLRPFSPNTQDTEGVSISIEEEEEYAIERSEHMHSMDSPHENNLKKLHTVNRDEHFLPNAPRFDGSAENRGVKKSEDSEQNQNFNRDSTFKENVVMESSGKQLPRAVTKDNSKQNNSELPPPPPLPKSPSDSWLCRTLPSMTTKHSTLRLFTGPATKPGNYCSKAPTSDMKWETIVKNTKVQRRHFHFSEESLTTIHET